MSNVKSLSVVAAALIGSVALAGVANASPFASADLGQGYMQVGEEKPAEGKCGECHEGDTSKFSSFQKVPSSVCNRCHANVMNQHPVMHGPVSAGECLLCHNPHESSVKGMLNDDPPAVCMQCHVSEFLPQDAQHQDPKQNCLNCHVAHGGQKRGLLLESYNRQALTTQPTTAPAPQDTGRILSGGARA